MYGEEDIQYITQVWLINELIHIFALIHDDICDQWDTRHHQPTYHKKLASYYQNEHAGVAQAIIIGDLIYTWAIRLMLDLIDSKPASDIIYTMLEQVICGQMLDIHYSHETATRTLEDIALKRPSQIRSVHLPATYATMSNPSWSYNPSA